jgi:hypothetical protein
VRTDVSVGGLRCKQRAARCFQASHPTPLPPHPTPAPSPLPPPPPPHPHTPTHTQKVGTKSRIKGGAAAESRGAQDELHSATHVRAWAGSWRLAVCGWRLAAGGWRLAAGGWRRLRCGLQLRLWPPVSPIGAGRAGPPGWEVPCARPCLCGALPPIVPRYGAVFFIHGSFVKCTGIHKQVECGQHAWSRVVNGLLHSDVGSSSCPRSIQVP